MSEITEINKDTFWELIDQAKEHQGDPNEWLMGRLVDMGPEQAKRFDIFTRVYMDDADLFGLWSAASVMGRRSCSEEGFVDFRAWLIGQGRKVYLAALKYPNSLADASSYLDDEFGSLAYMGDRAYKKLTGRNTSQDYDPAEYHACEAEVEPDIVYGEGIFYACKWNKIAKHLPRLCAKYLTPEDLAFLVQHHEENWVLTYPDVKQAREAATKSKKAKCQGGDAR